MSQWVVKTNWCTDIFLPTTDFFLTTYHRSALMPCFMITSWIKGIRHFRLISITCENISVHWYFFTYHSCFLSTYHCNLMSSFMMKCFRISSPPGFGQFYNLHFKSSSWAEEVNYYYYNYYYYFYHYLQRFQHLSRGSQWLRGLPMTWMRSISWLTTITGRS